MNRVTLRTSKCFSMVCIVLIFGSIVSAQQMDSLSPQQAEERRIMAVNYIQRNDALLRPLPTTTRSVRPSITDFQKGKPMPQWNVESEVVNQGVYIHNIYILNGLAPAALAAGDDQQAQKYARDLAALADKLKSEFPGEIKSTVDSAIYLSNIVLGLVALKAGETNQAKEHLLAAARINAPDPVLTSFGPDMLLAKQLLEKGERDTVLQYFELCAAFWERGQERLGQWKEAVERGETPKFRGSVRAVTDVWRFDQR